MASSGTAAQRWNLAMAEWAIPAEILDAAPRRPFVFVPEMFAAPEPGTFEPSLSNRRAAEALGDGRSIRGGGSIRDDGSIHDGGIVRGGGSVLDVGCGGGAAAFALVPPATEVVGTDRQSDMLKLFAVTAEQRGVAASVYEGSWPDVASEVPVADVVVCHNVLYNVTDIAPFVAALDAHARRRVVVEITPKHPQDRRRELWRHFWNLERPREPTAADAVAAITEAGLSPVAEESTLSEDRLASRRRDLEAAYWCRQMCLPPEREAEVAAMMADAPFPRERVTIWWDKQP